jgi:error-prone DNA polymerase
MYVEMHSRSAFSFLEAASLPEALAESCADKGAPAIALLDHDGAYGSPRMHMAAKKAGIKAHVGAEVSLDDALFGTAARCRYPLIVETRLGYQNICRLMTRYKLREQRKGEGAATFSATRRARCRIDLPYRWRRRTTRRSADARRMVEHLTQAFGRRSV